MHPIIRLISELELYLQTAETNDHEKWEVTCFIAQLNRKMANGKSKIDSTSANVRSS